MICDFESFGCVDAYDVRRVLSLAWIYVQASCVCDAEVLVLSDSQTQGCSGAVPLFISRPWASSGGAF